MKYLYLHYRKYFLYELKERNKENIFKKKILLNKYNNDNNIQREI